MKLAVCSTAYAFAVLSMALIAVSGEQQRILRRVIKSTPTATNLARIRLVTVRSPSAETGSVAEISSKEAASFGQRNANETSSSQQLVAYSGNVKSKQAPTSTTTTSTTLSPTTSASPGTPTTTTITATKAAPTTTTTTAKPEPKHKASDRQQSPEVELLSGAPSSWQSMTSIEAPVAMLIATGARAAVQPSVTGGDLSQSSSTLHSQREESTGDFLRASSTKSNYIQQESAFSRIRQATKTQPQQTYFYPPQAPARVSAGKTSNYAAVKGHWYQPPATTSTTTAAPPQEQQQYEQQSEQYVEQQQQQVEYGPAPLGMAEPFAFDFNTQDSRGNGQYRKEESDKNGVVRGSYGYTDANGIYRHVEYVADQNGFRANIKSNEPGLIGETQPASIQLAGGSAPSPSQRYSAPGPSASAATSNEYSDWAKDQSEGLSSADLALAPPDFESSHKSDRTARQAPRHYRN